MNEYNDYSNWTGQLMGFTAAELWQRKPLRQYDRQFGIVDADGSGIVVNFGFLVAMLAARMVWRHYMPEMGPQWIVSVLYWALTAAVLYFGAILTRDVLLEGVLSLLETFSATEAIARPKACSEQGASEAVSGAGKAPVIPCVILEVVLPIRERQAIIGDLQEMYGRDLLPAYGRRISSLVYWSRCLREVVYYSWPFLRKAVPWGAIITLLATGKTAWIAGVVKRLLGY